MAKGVSQLAQGKSDGKRVKQLLYTDVNNRERWQKYTTDSAGYDQGRRNKRQLTFDRRLGEILKRTVKRGGSGSNQHANKQRSHGATFAGKLPEGVNKTQSSRWQKVVAVPEPEFTGYIAKARENWANLHGYERCQK
jgi:hypothetical protein